VETYQPAKFSKEDCCWYVSCQLVHIHSEGESNGPDLIGFQILFKFRFSGFGQDLGVI